MITIQSQFLQLFLQNNRKKKTNHPNIQLITHYTMNLWIREEETDNYLFKNQVNKNGIILYYLYYINYTIKGNQINNSDIKLVNKLDFWHLCFWIFLRFFLPSRNVITSGINTTKTVPIFIGLFYIVCSILRVSFSLRSSIYILTGKQSFLSPWLLRWILSDFSALKSKLV